MGFAAGKGGVVERGGHALDAEGTGRLAKLVASSTQVGLQPTSLARREPFARELEVRQLAQRDADPLQALGEPGGQGTQHGPRRQGTHVGERRGEQRTPLALVLGPSVGRDQGQGLAPGESVLLGGHQERLLGRAMQPAQRQGQGHTDLPAIDARARLRGEPGGQQLARGDPGAALSQQLGDRLGPIAVLDAQRMDQARLVHDRERPRGSIGLEQLSPRLGAAGGLLDQHRDVGRTRRSPARQALVSVEDQQTLGAPGHDAQRQRAQALFAAAGWSAAALRREGCLELLDWHEQHAGRARGGARADRLRRGARRERRFHLPPSPKWVSGG